MEKSHFYWQGYDSGWSDCKSGKPSLFDNPLTDSIYGTDLADIVDGYLAGYIDAVLEDSFYPDDEEEICRFCDDDFPDDIEDEDDFFTDGLEGVDEDDQNAYYHDEEIMRAYLLGASDAFLLVADIIEAMLHG